MPCRPLHHKREIPGGGGFVAALHDDLDVDHDVGEPMGRGDVAPLQQLQLEVPHVADDVA